MEELLLHEWHQSLRARFADERGAEVVRAYGDEPAEHRMLTQTVGVLDLSFRSRLCLTGADRVRFLHGQVTNDVKRLRPGEGCYAALVTAKGKMQSDLNIYCLQDELLLDFEPGLAGTVRQRLEKYVVADDVQVIDVAPHYGLLTVQGPRSTELIHRLELFSTVPEKPYEWGRSSDATLGETYLMNHSRLGRAGFDLFVPVPSLREGAARLLAEVESIGGGYCGLNAFEIARIEAGIPRFGVDMDETNLPLECGIEARAISYNKGCYIGQEVINRIHSIGHVNRELRGLRFASQFPNLLPTRNDRLFRDGAEVGYVTSATRSPKLGALVALAYVRREANQAGTELLVRTQEGESRATVVALPFNV